MLNAQLKFLYKDDDILVVHKMPGIHVHPSLLSKGELSLKDMLCQYGFDFAQPVHRLDRPCSGPVIFALKPEHLPSLSLQFSDCLVKKKYLALVRGWLTAARFEDSPIDDQLGGQPKPALSYIEPLQNYEIAWQVAGWQTMRLSLVQVKPETGRRHQIRRHLKRLNHPILADFVHGDRHHNHAITSLLGPSRLQLACIQLAFNHPASGSLISINDGIEDHEEWFLNDQKIQELIIQKP